MRRIARGDVRYRLSLGGVGGQFGVSNCLAVWQNDGAVGGFELFDRHACLVGGRLFQRLARDRAGIAQLVETVWHGGRPARALDTHDLDQGIHDAARGFCGKAAVGRHEGHALGAEGGVPVGFARLAEIGFELAEFNVQLFGDQRRLNRNGALALVGMRCDQGDLFAVNLDPRVEHGFAGLLIIHQRIGRIALDHIGAKSHAACNGDGSNQKGASSNCFHASHITPPSGFWLPFSQRRGCEDRYRSGTDCRT